MEMSMSAAQKMPFREVQPNEIADSIKADMESAKQEINEIEDKRSRLDSRQRMLERFLQAGDHFQMTYTVDEQVPEYPEYGSQVPHPESRGRHEI